MVKKVASFVLFTQGLDVRERVRLDLSLAAALLAPFLTIC
jgi:hypothetical protein